MTRIYVDGKRVSKEELSRIEITNENAKRIFREALKTREIKEAVGG